MIVLAGTLALCSFGLEMTIGTFLGHALMAVCDMTIRMDFLPNVKQGNQLHLIWAFFGPNFGPNRPIDCHKGGPRKVPMVISNPKGHKASVPAKKSPICIIKAKRIQDNPLEHFSYHPQISNRVYSKTAGQIFF